MIVGHAVNRATITTTTTRVTHDLSHFNPTLTGHAPLGRNGHGSFAKEMHLSFRRAPLVRVGFPGGQFGHFFGGGSRRGGGGLGLLGKVLADRLVGPAGGVTGKESDRAVVGRCQEVRVVVTDHLPDTSGVSQNDGFRTITTVPNDNVSVFGTGRQGAVAQGGQTQQHGGMLGRDKGQGRRGLSRRGISDLDGAVVTARVQDIVRVQNVANGSLVVVGDAQGWSDRGAHGHVNGPNTHRVTRHDVILGNPGGSRGYFQVIQSDRRQKGDANGIFVAR